LQHQNKSTATSEQGDCNNKTKLLQREMQYQKKETNATKKYYLLQYQNKATTTTEQSAMRESNIRKKLMQQRNITCYDIRTRLLQCEIQHQK
jgi:hypothetical protein